MCGSKSNSSLQFDLVESFYKSLMSCFDEQFKVNEGDIGIVLVFSPIGIEVYNTEGPIRALGYRLHFLKTK